MRHTASYEGETSANNPEYASSSENRRKPNANAIRGIQYRVAKSFRVHVSIITISFHRNYVAHYLWNNFRTNGNARIA